MANVRDLIKMSAEEVDAIDAAGHERDAYCWAWLGEEERTVRARGFFPAEGIVEDEATGSAALRIGAFVGRPLEIRQGEGSLLHARPGPDGTVEVGGRVRDRGAQPYGR